MLSHLNPLITYVLLMNLTVLSEPGSLTFLPNRDYLLTFQGHLLLGYAYVLMSNKVHSISWTIPHCVLVLKLIGKATLYNLAHYCTERYFVYHLCQPVSE